jgi:photosystem II stability/assembly factor-like uncharacterized protein
MKRVVLVTVVALLAVAVGNGYASNGWYEFESPTQFDINALSFVNNKNGWAVGYWGTILRFRNGKWTKYDNWPTQYLQDVSFGAANFGMAVGYRGAGCYYNGTTWSAANVPTTRNMYAVSVPPGSTNTAWAAGAGGQLWRWNGAWSRWNLGITQPFHDIYFSSETDGWLAGDNGRIFHFTGTAWNSVSTATTNDFYCIYALSPNNCWVGGTNGSLYHYEGVTWVKTYTPTNTTIREMAFNGPTDGWAVCDGGVVLKYNGVQWNKVPIYPSTTKSFSGMTMINEKHGWAVGTKGMIYEYRNFPGVTPTSLGKVKSLFN